MVYNDVNLPGKRGNIDHVVIGPTGIYVIETKNYSGRYRIKATNGCTTNTENIRNSKVILEPRSGETQYILLIS